MPAQCQVHIIPARIIRTDIHAAGVVQHDALRVGGVYAQGDAGFLNARNIGLDLVCLHLPEGLRQCAVLQRTCAQVFFGDLCQNMRGVYQRILRGLAHTGFDFFDEDIQYEPRGNAHE